MNVSKARRGRLITTSGFAVYDHCLNPYVGCQFGCTYCYVRFYIKDKVHPWGGWVRTRDHIRTHLNKEITSIGPTRLIMGTMTDPYQPVEATYLLTQKALQTFKNHPTQMKRVGIWTRSPLVRRDADLIASLPDPWVHITIAPFSRDAMRLVEPYPIEIGSRFKTAEILKKAGVQVAIAISPTLPIFSDDMRESMLQQIRDIGIDEFQVDPLQPYKDAMDTITPAIQTHERAADILALIGNKKAYKAWKTRELADWSTAWKKDPRPGTLALGIDHVTKEKFDMTTGSKLAWDHRP